MNSSVKIAFLLLVLVQGLHSIEEYYGRLWEVFPPARFLTGLISSDHEVGFLIANTGLFVFGIWCWLIPIRENLSFAKGLVWFWIVIEVINGIGHPVWAIYEGRYVPGLATAPVLFLLAVYLMLQSLNAKSEAPKEEQ